MSKKKLLIVIGVAVFLVGVVVGSLGFFTKGNEIKLRFSHVLPVDQEVKYATLELSKRGGETGEATTLLERTSEDKTELPKEVMSRLEGFSLQESREKPNAGDFISFGVVMSEERALRIEIYRDSSVLVIGGDYTGIYKAVSSQEGADTPYDLLYIYLTGEAPR